MTTYTVSSATDLQAVLSGASGGDVIELAAGDYGNLSLRGLDFDSEVTIRSAEAADPAVFNTINIIESSNLTFDSLFIDFTPTEGTVEWSSAFRAVQGVSNITLRNSKVEGGDSIAGVSPDSEPGEQGASGILGEPIGRAITITGTNIVIENNDISHFNRGIVTSGDGNAILNNEIYDLRTSPLAGGGSDLIIDGNYFHDSNPWKMGGAGDHGDYVHLWTQPGGQPMSNITITNNVFSDEEGGSLLGIYLDDNLNEVGFTNVVVEGNVIHSSTGQAVRFENVSDATISRNTILNADGVEKQGSQLVLTDGTKNIRLEDNIVSTFFGEAQQQALAEKGIIFKNNIDVDHDGPNAANFVGKIFADSRLEGSDLWEKILLPGSVADGLGSPLMHLDEESDRLTPIFKVEHAEDEIGGLILRADQTRGPEGPVTDAEFIWDFGDGTVGTGQVVRHTYADAGRYQVTLTAVAADGATAKATSEIGIKGADILLYDPQSGFFQFQEYGTITAIEGTDKASVSTEVGYGIDLGGTGSVVSVDKSQIARLFGAESFDMSMTLRADTLGSIGEVARVHGNFILSVASRGEVSLQLWTDAESKALTTTGVTVNDGADHDVRISFDGATNSLMIYVDDRLAAATEIEGRMRGDYPRSLDFGNPWGKQNFDGTLTAFDLEVGSQDYPAYDGAIEPVSDTETSPAEDVISPPDSPDTGVTEPAPEEAPAADNTADNGDTVTSEPVEPEDATPVPESDPATTEPVDAPAPEEESAVPGSLLNGGYQLDVASVMTSDTVRLHDDAYLVETEDGSALSFDGKKDFASLGRLTDFEASQKIAFSVGFVSDNADGGAERLVWNHLKLGLTLEGDGLRVHAGNNDDPFWKGFEVDGLGLNDGNRHTATVMVDAEADRLQVVVNDVLVLDEQGTDFDFVGAGGNEWGWSLGTAWNRWFEGEVHEFQVSDDFDFLETSVTTDDAILA